MFEDLLRLKENDLRCKAGLKGEEEKKYQKQYVFS